jgi:radical SAM protein with 4Fe4S-binding SPASM domain
MPPDLFRQCLENIDVKLVTLFRLFNFGEPLLHPELEEIFRSLLDSPLQTHWIEISTNAQSNAEDKLEAIVAMGGLNLLTISCDGDGTPEKYEALRPPGKWSKLMSFLGFARNLAKHYPSLHLKARCVIEQPEDKTRWQEILRPFGVVPEFRGWLQLPDSLMDKARDSVPMGTGGCAIASEARTLYVDHQGNVVPCCFHPNAAFLGNLSMNRYSDLFWGPKRMAFLEALRLRRAEMRVCNRCDMGADPKVSPSTEAVERFAHKRQ